jgi:hypothetical protein
MEEVQIYAFFKEIKKLKLLTKASNFIFFNTKNFDSPFWILIAPKWILLNATLS